MTQGELERIPEKIVKAMTELEIRIMEDIVRRIRENGFSTATADWQFSRLKQLGMSERQIKEWIQEALGVSLEELEQIYSGQAYEEYMQHRRAYEIYGQEQIPFEDNDELQHLIEGIKRQTAESFRNITGSMGFVKRVGNRLLARPLTEYYRETLDNAIYDIKSGGFSYSTVINRAINELTNSGIRTIDYASGHADRVPVAVRRAVMTGFRQVQGKINEQVAEDLHTDTYEVTIHIGARPTHQPWEGKVWTMEELHTVCGLGDALGLHGINCYHDYHPFITGVSVRTYTDEQLEQIHEQENKPKEYLGKSYTTYEALQRQRALERRARKLREDVHLLEQGGGSEEDILAKKARYKATLAEYKDFSEKMGLPMQRERIYQDGLKVDMDVAEGHKNSDSSFGDVEENLPKYVDVTETWNKNLREKEAQVSDSDHYTAPEGTRYDVDGVNVFHRHTEEEKTLAKEVSKATGKIVKMVPEVVGKYKNVKSPDFVIENGDTIERWEEKAIKCKGKDPLRNEMSSKKAENYVFDVSGREVDIDAVLGHAENVFTAYNTTYVKTVAIYENGSFVKVYRRK